MKRILALASAVALVFGVAGVSFADENADEAAGFESAASRANFYGLPTSRPPCYSTYAVLSPWVRAAMDEQPEPEPEVEVAPFNNNEKWQPENELSDSPNWPMP